MATKSKEGEGFMNVSRRDFLKFSATAAAVGGGWALGYDPSAVLAYEGDPNYTIKPTTCPYCSASCGQRVVVDNATGEVVDIYGDFESPMNQGGLCAKGAGAFQLVTNPRRVGAYTYPLVYQGKTMTAHPEDPIFANDGTSNAVVYKRTGTGSWSKMALATALAEIGPALKSARGNFTAGEASGYNSQSVVFFGCSHMNNEENYLYRRLIAQFGTTNTEHQARI